MLRQSSRSLAGLVLLLFARFATAQGTAPDPNEEAGRLAAEGAEAYNAGDLDHAIDRFLEAMTWVADPAFAYNLAFIYDELGVLYPAYHYYGLYLELYPGAPNLADIETRRAEIEAIFDVDYAEVHVTTTPGGAEVWVRAGGREDDFGTAPLTLWVAPGTVTLEARLAGYAPVTRQLNAVAGVRVPLELALAPLPPEEPVASPLWPWAYGTMGTGLALMGVGIGFWVASNGSADDYNAAVARLGEDPDPPSLSELRALGEDAEDQARIGNVLFGVGASVLAGGVVLFVLALDDAGELRGASPRSGQARGGAESGDGWRLQPAGLGLELMGRF